MLTLLRHRVYLLSALLALVSICLLIPFFSHAQGFVPLAYAGYLYMGQSDMWSHKGEAKQIITDVTIGFLLLLAIYLILYQINPDILKLKALERIKPVQSAPGQQSAPAANPATDAFSTPMGGSAIPNGNGTCTFFTAEGLSYTMPCQ